LEGSSRAQLGPGLEESGDPLAAGFAGRVRILDTAIELPMEESRRHAPIEVGEVVVDGEGDVGWLAIA
jgi:hypothetical protein